MTPNILVMDDDRQIRQTLKTFFERNKFRVLCAGDGEQGLRLFKEHKIDLVITDLFMPEKDGLEIILQLKKEDPLIKIIAISGGAQRCNPDTFLVMASQLGADSIFEKPVDPYKLLITVENLIGDGSEKPKNHH